MTGKSDIVADDPERASRITPDNVAKFFKGAGIGLALTAACLFLNERLVGSGSAGAADMIAALSLSLGLFFFGRSVGLLKHHLDDPGAVRLRRVLGNYLLGGMFLALPFMLSTTV